jgi:hypothetical protein
MTNPYGPWATSIDAGGNPQLSAFWRRRLTMLEPTSQTSPALSRRNLLWLGAAGVLTAALPTLHSAAVIAEEENPANADKKPSAATPIPPQKAIAMMESLEKKIQVLRWKAHCVEPTVASATDFTSVIKTEPTFWDYQVVLDPVGRRYHVEMQGVLKWFEGVVPYSGTACGYSFDGKVYRAWSRDRNGDQLPTGQEPTDGVISGNRKDIGWPNRESDLIQFDCIRSGIGCMPPYFWDGEVPPQPLSRLVRKWMEEKREVSIVEGKEGLWTITTPVKYPAPKGFTLHIRYDPTKGGVVTGANWVFLREAREVDNIRMEVELQKVADKLWAPRTVRWAFTLDKTPIVTTTSFKAVTINPSVEPNAFQLTFPEGARVTDYTK